MKPIEKKLGYLITIIESTESYINHLLRLIEVSEVVKDIHTENRSIQELDNFFHLSYLHATSVVELAVITKNLETLIIFQNNVFL